MQELMDDTGLANDIFNFAVNAVKPGKLVSSCLKIKAGILSAGDFRADLSEIRNIYLTGAGKASAAMALEAEKIIGDRITGGHIVTKYGHSLPLKYVTVTEAGHPFPDANGYTGTEKISAIAEAACSDDLFIFLLSGGGSALLADKPDILPMTDIEVTNRLLVNCGASIDEINTVRKHLSQLKGGGLAAKAFPASVLTLVLSDVPGDSLTVIASGPTCPDTTTFADALSVLDKYKLVSKVPSTVADYLRQGVAGMIKEKPSAGERVFDNVHNILTGNNRMALEAAAAHASEAGIRTIRITGDMNGDTADYATKVVQDAISIKTDDSIPKPACLLYGGETTVKVEGNGAGGRNQHFALVAALALDGVSGITVLAAGTDGTDGPTDAAGAVADGSVIERARKLGIDPAENLKSFNSWKFFKMAGGHIITGPTLTNVMDIVIVIIR